MEILIVDYRAFDRPHSAVFVGKTAEEIHDSLRDRCNTYVPTAIVKTEFIEYLPLKILNDLQTKTRMQAFTITKKIHNLLTNQVEVDYFFTIKGEARQKTEVFSDIHSANAYLEASMRDWFLLSLQVFVHHKRHIIESGAHANQFDALKICDQALEHYQKKSLGTLISLFLGGITWFEKILPHTNNNSYQTSLCDLLELKNFCETYLKDKNATVK